MRNNIAIFSKAYATLLTEDVTEENVKFLKMNVDDAVLNITQPYQNWCFAFQNNTVYVQYLIPGEITITTVVRAKYIVEATLTRVPVSSTDRRGDDSGYDFDIRISSLD